MKILKFFLMMFLLLSMLSAYVCAEHLPEENLIGKEMIVEKDSNIVKDNIDADKNPEFVPKYDKINVTKAVFFKKFTRPAIILLFSGLAVFTVVTVFEHRKEKIKHTA